MLDRDISPISTELENKVATRQLYSSLLAYMSSEDFNPEITVDPQQIKALYE